MIFMKLSRLLSILIILLNQKTITASQLAERFEVSVRTIYRDIEMLSATGIPIYNHSGNEWWYFYYGKLHSK